MLFYKTKTLFPFIRPEDRSEDDIDLVYEDIMNIKAFSHLSNTVKKELSAVIAFEAHKEKSTTCEFCHIYFLNFYQTACSV